MAFLKIQELRGQPNGEEALNVIFSDEAERTKYDAIVALQESGVVGSMFEANKFMNQPKTPWAFDGKREEQKYNKTFEGIPVNIANRGRKTYTALRARGVGHDVAMGAVEKAIEAKDNVGGIEIYGSKQPFSNSEAVKSSIGTHIDAMTKPYGEEITHSFDMWSNSIVSTNEFGVIINTSNRDELINLATTKEAFDRDAKEHNIRRAFARGGDTFNTQVQKFVRLKGKSIDGSGETPAYYETPDKVYNFFMNTYTIGKGVRKDGTRITGE